MTIDDLPALNAVLNAASALLLLGGYLLIRRSQWRGHAALMISALALSGAFLTSYLILHANRPPRSFAVQGTVIRPLYFTILLTHTILAAAILPLVGITLWQVIRRRWARHRQVARWTFPLWLYVSVTGVVIYAMLYHL